MKQTTVQIKGMMSSFSDAGAGRRIKRRNGVGKVDAKLLNGAATVRAVGHEGHTMPMPPAVKPAKEKIKPKAPPPPPVAKPPEKKTKNQLGAARRHCDCWGTPTTGASRGSISAKIGSVSFAIPASISG
jgi:hypothetical protein